MGKQWKTPTARERNQTWNNVKINESESDILVTVTIASSKGAIFASSLKLWNGEPKSVYESPLAPPFLHISSDVTKKKKTDEGSFPGGSE